LAKATRFPDDIDIGASGRFDQRLRPRRELGITIAACERGVSWVPHGHLFGETLPVRPGHQCDQFERVTMAIEDT